MTRRHSEGNDTYERILGNLFVDGRTLWLVVYAHVNEL